MKHEVMPENKEMIFQRFKHIKTDKIDYDIIIGCESDEVFKNDKLFNFWSIKFINQEIEMKISK